MNLLAYFLAVAGIYLINSGVTARPPIQTLTDIARDPKNARTILTANEGKLASAAEGSGTSSGIVTGGGDFSAKSDGVPWSVTSSPKNGRLSNTELSSLSFSAFARLSPKAAAQMEELNKAYKAKFGTSILITSSYRSYQDQANTYAAKPKLAAKPGQSNHGLGLAVDLGGGINTRGSKQHAWMLENAPRYGWVHPRWAYDPAAKHYKNEPWHWEYVG